MCQPHAALIPAALYFYAVYLQPGVNDTHVIDEWGNNVDYAYSVVAVGAGEIAVVEMGDTVHEPRTQREDRLVALAEQLAPLAGEGLVKVMHQTAAEELAFIDGLA